MNEQLPDQNQPAGHNHEVVERQKWETVFETVEGLGLHADTHERAGQVGAMTGENLMDAATRLHTVLVPGESHEPTDYMMYTQSPDGTNRTATVAPSERQGVYETAADLVGRLNATRQAGDEEAFLKRAGNLVALSLVLAHPFAEGNGRTARTLAHVIREGYDGGSEVQDDIRQVGANRPPEGFRIISYVPVNEGKALSAHDLLVQAAALEIPLARHDEYVEKTESYFTSPYVD